jgi:hypothetical protein
MIPTTYVNATKYALDVVGKLDGIIFANCSDYNLARCIHNAIRYSADAS